MTRFYLLFSFIMSITFIAAGPLIIAFPPDAAFIRDNKELAGFVLIIYGIFRLYRTYLLWKEQKE